MNLKRFTEFCAKKQMPQATREAFLKFLQDKYPNGIPADVNLTVEYGEFYRESTSRA